MKDLFKVTVKIGKIKQVELLFDDQNRAERFINSTIQVMTAKGKKEVEFTPELVSLIDCDEDVIEAFSSAIGK